MSRIDEHVLKGFLAAAALAFALTAEAGMPRPASPQALAHVVGSGATAAGAGAGRVETAPEAREERS